MSWSEAVLSTPESIARFEKEINTITRAAEEEAIYSGIAGATEVISDAICIRGFKGFGLLRVELTDTAENKTVTIKLYDADAEDGDFNDDLMTFVLAQAKHGSSFTYDLQIPVSIQDWIKVGVLSSANVNNLDVTLLSAWTTKHELAKDRIAVELQQYITGSLDDIEDYTPLEIPTDYYVLHLIYSDLMIGYGENEIYENKMKFYYQQFQSTLKAAIRQLTYDGASIVTESIISR